MATNYLVLGQVAPAATANTTLYTAPAATQAVISSITVCNRSSVQAKFRVAVRPNGASITDSHYVAYDTPIESNDVIAMTLGLTLGDTDVVTVYASSSLVSFGAFGSEIT